MTLRTALWAAAGGTVCVLGLGLYVQTARLQAAQAAAAEANRQVEAAELRESGYSVVEPVDEAGLRRQLHEALSSRTSAQREAAELRDRIRRLQRDHGAELAAIAERTTGPVESAPEATPTATCPVQGDVPPCLFAAGDAGEIQVLDVAVRMDAGNLVVEGLAEARRVRPAPVSPLFRGLLRATAPDSIERVPPPACPSRGWGLGAQLGLVSESWVAGPVLAGPPVRFWRLGEIEPSVAAAVGPSGDWTVTGSAVWRF